jgi:hypothetical protein
MNTEDLARLVVTEIRKRMWRESVFLYPVPSWHISDPHGLLDAIRDSGAATTQQIQAWLEDAAKTMDSKS